MTDTDRINLLAYLDGLLAQHALASPAPSLLHTEESYRALLLTLLARGATETVAEGAALTAANTATPVCRSLTVRFSPDFVGTVAGNAILGGRSEVNYSASSGNLLASFQITRVTGSYQFSNIT
jgi:hypothetical protein